MSEVNINEEKKCSRVRIVLKYFFGLMVGLVILCLSAIHLLAYKGVPEAEVLLASFFRDGILIYPKNISKAKELYLSAAKKNYPQAQCELGWIYEKEKNYKYALYLYNIAALQNLSQCQFNLGTMYDRGLGIKKDQEKAFLLYKFAADNGYNPAQFSVGFDYINAIGVKRDISMGLGYLQKSAEKNNKDAQGYLALLYFSSDYISQNLEVSRKWAELARANGDSNSQFILNEISKITSHQNKE